MKINYQGTPPNHAHPTDAGGDLTAAQTTTIPVGKWALIQTNTKIAIPAGHHGKICPRSGLAAKHGVTVLNAPGIVDADYRGNIGVVLINHGAKPFRVQPGDRIAQLIIEQHITPEYVPGDLDTTGRGEGGFGSTGKK